MAFALLRYTANGSTNTFNVTFSYRSTDDVIVKLDGVTKTITTHYTFPTTGQIQFGSMPTNGQVVEIRRSTSQSSRLVDYQAGAVIKESDLDNDSIQGFNMAQEAIDITDDALTKDSLDRYDATSKRIINVTDPTGAQDASTKNYVDTKFAADVSTVAASATSAASSATASASSATASASSATASASSATAAAASYDSFDDRYLGAKSSDPTVDNDGATLLDGAIYFNTTSNVMKVYDLGNTNWITIKPTSTEQGHITTVAGISSNVTTVAGKATEIGRLGTADAVADMAILATTDVVADMNTLGTADVVADMNTLGTADVVSDMNTLGTADVVADMNTLATADVVADMNTLGTADVVSDMNTLGTADVVSDMNTLATTANVNNMNTVAGISSNVTTVAGISSAVSGVNAIASAVSAVNSNSSNINTVSGISSNVTALGNISTDVTSLASAISSTTNYAVTVASGTLYGGGSGNVFHIDGSGNPALTLTRGNTYVFDQSNSSNSGHPIAFRTSADASYTTGVTVTGTAGSSGAKVTFVVPSDAPASLKYYCTAHGNGMGNLITTVTSNINVVASNIGSVNEFGQRYRVGTSDPSSSLDDGDLFFNTSDNQMKFYDGSNWVALSADTDVKTKVSANDTTAGFLNGKLTAGANISLTEGSDGGNETLAIAVTGALGGGNYLGNNGEIGSSNADIIRVHAAELSYSGTLTLASTENGMVAGPFSIAGSTILDVQGTLVVL